MILACPACAKRFLVDPAALGEAGRVVRCASCRHEWLATPESDEDFAPAATPLIEDGDAFGENDSAVTEEAEDFSDSDSEEAGEYPAAGSENGMDEQEPGLEAYSPVPESLLETPAFPQTAAANAAVWPWIAGFAAALLLATGLTLLLYRESLATPQGALAPLYRLAGYYPSDGVMLTEVSLETLPSRRKKRYRLHCSIINKAEEPRRLPHLAMKLLNGRGDVLAEEGNFLSLTPRLLKAGEKVSCGKLIFESPFSSAETVLLDLGSPLELSLRGDWPGASGGGQEQEEARPETLPEKKAHD